MSNTGMSAEVAAALLGVDISATKEEVEKAFKLRARLVHPDRFESNSTSYSAAEESMKQLNVAKEAMLSHISNPVKEKAANETSSSSTDSQPSSTQRPQSPKPAQASQSDDDSEAKPVEYWEHELITLKTMFSSTVKSLLLFVGFLILGIIGGAFTFVPTIFDHQIWAAFIFIGSIAIVAFVWHKIVVRWEVMLEISQEILDINKALRVYKRKNKKR